MTPLPYLGVRYQIRYHTCNLNCPYCIVKWKEQNDLFDANAFNAIVEKLFEMPYRISLRVGVGGEPFTSREFLNGIRKICNSDNNIQGVSFSTNLVADWNRVISPFIESVNPGKLGIGCTLHDMVIRDVDDFFSKIRKLKECGVALYVGLVAIPSRIDFIRKYKKICGEIGVPLILNGLVGKLIGEESVDSSLEYPRDYTPFQRNELRSLWDTPHSYQILINSCNTKGMECSAGTNYIYINHHGDVFPCSQVKQKMGNLLHDKIEFLPEDMRCPVTTCWCGNENQAMRIVDRYYNRSHILRMFTPKPGLSNDQLYDGYQESIFHTNYQE